MLDEPEERIAEDVIEGLVGLLRQANQPQVTSTVQGYPATRQRYHPVRKATRAGDPGNVAAAGYGRERNGDAAAGIATAYSAAVIDKVLQGPTVAHEDQPFMLVEAAIACELSSRP
jgi:hypothetical protein